MDFDGIGAGGGGLDVGEVGDAVACCTRGVLVVGAESGGRYDGHVVLLTRLVAILR